MPCLARLRRARSRTSWIRSTLSSPSFRRGSFRSSLRSVSPRGPAVELPVRDLREWRQPGRGDDRLEALAFMELDPIAVDDDRVRIGRGEPAELRVDESKAPRHVLDLLVRAPPLQDVLLDGVGARRQDNDAVGIPAIADGKDLAKPVVRFFRILHDVGFESDPRPFDEDHAIRPVMLPGVAVIGVVQLAEVCGDADGVQPRLDVHEDARIPHAFLAFSVRPVLIQVAELAYQRALSDSRATYDGDAHHHGPRFAGTLPVFQQLK